MALFDIVLDGVKEPHIVISNEGNKTTTLRDYVERAYVVKVDGVPYVLKEARKVSPERKDEFDTIHDDVVKRTLEDWKNCTGYYDPYKLGGKVLGINEYQKLALRTAPKDLTWDDLLLNGLMGLNGEAGEAIDILKKSLFQGHSLDMEHMAKELGDVAWYLAVSAEAIGYSLEDILKMNINKLRARYPEGFDTELSQHRKEGDV